MKKVLIIEDDRKISMALAIRVKSKGYEVLTAFDGLIGLSEAVKHKPDLVILDINLPAGSGFQTAERMQGLCTTIGTPMIFMTASKKPGLREKAEELGAFAFFEKPYDAEELLASVHEAIGDPVPAG